MEIARAQQIPIQSVPLKGLLPLIEKSSLEDVDDDQMVSMWAGLLASAAVGQSDLLPRYTTILSELNSATARLFEHIVARDHDLSIHSADELGLDADLTGDWVIRELRREDRGTDPEIFIEFIVEMLNFPGAALDTIALADGENSYDWPGLPGEMDDPRRISHDQNFLGFSTLENLGLLERHSFQQASIGQFLVSVWYHVVTPIGYDLYACCNPGKLKRFNTGGS
jgi:hypothetical protein